MEKNRDLRPDLLFLEQEPLPAAMASISIINLIRLNAVRRSNKNGCDSILIDELKAGVRAH